MKFKTGLVVIIAVVIGVLFALIWDTLFYGKFGSSFHMIIPAIIFLIFSLGLFFFDSESEKKNKIINGILFFILSYAIYFLLAIQMAFTFHY